MENIIIALFDLLLFIFYITGGLIISMMIQGIVYWTTKISIYNKLLNKLFKEVK
jgi:hypothetical protein